MIQVTVDDHAVRARFAKMPDALRTELTKAMTRITLDLRNHVVRDKLRGQVLNRRTGALGRSIFNTVENNEQGVTGKVASSNDVKYGAMHEYGFNGTESVKAHIRTITQVFGRQLANPVSVSVRNFTRKVNMPERSFMRSSLADMKEKIVEQLESATIKAAVK